MELTFLGSLPLVGVSRDGGLRDGPPLPLLAHPAWMVDHSLVLRPRTESASPIFWEEIFRSGLCTALRGLVGEGWACREGSKGLVAARAFTSGIAHSQSWVALSPTPGPRQISI